MRRGYIKLWRRTQDTGLSCLHLGFWSHCLLSATHTARTVPVAGTYVDLLPGQFIFGRGAWSRELDLSEKVTRNLIGTMQKRAMIRAVKRASTFTVFEVVNWHFYQEDFSTGGQQKGQQVGQPEGQLGASSGPHLKNEEGENKNNPHTPFQGACVSPPEEPVKKKRATRAPKAFPPELTEVWEAAHPDMRACGSLAVLNVWEKLKRQGILPELPEVLAALARYRKEMEAQTGPVDRQRPYAHLRTWLNQGRWNTGAEVEVRTHAKVRQAREQAERATETAEARAQEVERAWARKWEGLPENVKEAWRQKALKNTPFLNAQHQEGKDVSRLLDVAGRGEWRRHWEAKERGAKEEKA